MPTDSDEKAPQTHVQRPVLHLRSKMNGNGVVKRPGGEVRMEKIFEEAKNPDPPGRGD